MIINILHNYIFFQAVPCSVVCVWQWAQIIQPSKYGELFLFDTMKVVRFEYFHAHPENTAKFSTSQFNLLGNVAVQFKKVI